MSDTLTAEPDSFLGVLDLKDGRAVHAVAGQRETYQMVKCNLTQSGDPMELARGYLRLGVGGLYVADLDAIERRRRNVATVCNLLELGCPVLLDAGFPLPHVFERFSNCWPVVGTESLTSLNQLVETSGPPIDRIVLSIDLRDGAVISKGLSLGDSRPLDVAVSAQRLGVRHLIVLELTSVGTAKGPNTVEICSQIHNEVPEIELLSGGGIRDKNDLISLENAGCKRFLIGTALHSGRKNSLIGDVTC